LGHRTQTKRLDTGSKKTFVSSRDSGPHSENRKAKSVIRGQAMKTEVNPFLNSSLARGLESQTSTSNRDDFKAIEDQVE